VPVLREELGAAGLDRAEEPDAIFGRVEQVLVAAGVFGQFLVGSGQQPPGPRMVTRVGSPAFFRWARSW
jgi:hypothetical protein